MRLPGWRTRWCDMTRTLRRVAATALLALIAVGLTACDDGYDKIGGPCTHAKPVSQNKAGRTLYCSPDQYWVTDTGD